MNAVTGMYSRQVTQPVQSHMADTGTFEVADTRVV
jgi:hypothetical protein